MKRIRSTKDMRERYNFEAREIFGSSLRDHLLEIDFDDTGMASIAGYLPGDVVLRMLEAARTQLS